MNKGVYDVPLKVSESLNGQKEILKQIIMNAQKNIAEFAEEHQWESLIEPSFIKQVEIYDSQESFVNALVTHFNLDNSIKLPDTVSAVLEDEILFSISPKVYQEIYPVEGNDSNGFERLLTHEIAHRLHVRILKGNEELMGPKWFFEGFAIYAAKQFPKVCCDEALIWDIIINQKDVGYQLYASIFKYLTQFVTINELVDHAGDEHFTEWLKTKCKTTGPVLN